MDGLDAFLDLCDADPDWDSEEEGDPFERLMKNSPNELSKSQDKKAAQAKDADNSFQELFGNPMQIKTKASKNGSQSTSTTSPVASSGPRPTKSPITPTPTKPWSKPEVKSTPSPVSATVPIPSKPRFVPKFDDSVVVTDPFTKLRLFKTSIQLYYDEVQPIETSLKERNMTLDFFPLPKMGGQKDRKNIWTSGVLVKRVPGIRKSAKGNEYGLWEIHDLDGDLTYTVFLFGAAGTADSLKVLPIGSLIDFMNPTVLDDGLQGKFKLSVANTNQIRHIATAKDFGYCGSRRKDGEACMMPVNKFKCDVCIHHASAELRKMNGKNKSNWAKQNAFPPGGRGTAGSYVEMGKPDRDGVIVANFGKKLTPTPPSSSSKISPASAALQLPKKKPLVRMELQDLSHQMKRNPISQGNHSTISFSKETNPMIDELPKVERAPRKKLDLDPVKTRHLTDDERQILVKLEHDDKKSELPNLLVDPNAGSRNYLKFLSKNASEGPGTYFSQGEGSSKSSPLVMNRQTLLSMKKALNFVKSNGPIAKRDPNSTASNRKRKLDEDLSEDSNRPGPSTSNGAKKILDPETKKALLLRESKKTGSSTDIEIDMSSDEFKQLLNAKSSHATLLEDVQEDEYFSKLERKEAIENKLLSTFSIPTSAVMCRDCKYVALSQSGFCKEQRHVIRVVKANKRFFKCKDCGNRTMSLDRLPKRPCTHCKGSCWLQASVGVERAGPKLDSEKLAIRGDEQSHLGGMGAKLVL